MILADSPGARVASVACTFPANTVDAETTASSLRLLFPGEDPAFLDQLVERSGVATRHLVPTVTEILGQPGFTTRNDRYRTAATDLATGSCRTALDQAGVDPGEIDVLIDVSCTGISIPALDVEIAQRLGLRPDVRRIPITASGCAGGALALGMAGCLAQGGLRILIVAVELCSLTFCEGDRSRTNLISSILFGDGAGAAVILPGGPGPRIEAVGSHLIPNTRDVMGFDVGEHGLRIRLDRQLPIVLKKNLRGAVDRFLEDHGRSGEDVGLHLVHPGGRRILDAYRELFHLEDDALRYSSETLRRFGNLSSVSILAVLDLALSDPITLPPGRDEVLMVGVGPGLSLEMMLLRWEGLRP